MGIWSAYNNRISALGGTIRNASLIRESRYINSKLPNNLSYTTAIVEGEEQNVAIINSDNFNEKKIISMPGEPLKQGSLVQWMDQYWLITEKDYNETIYIKAKMLQCNYLLKWVSDDDVIHEQWCVVEDGTKLERTLLVRDSLAYWKRYVKTTTLLAGNSLESYCHSGISNRYKRNGLKSIRIGQSAAKPRIEERSTTRLVATVGISIPKWVALNHKCGTVKI